MVGLFPMIQRLGETITPLFAASWVKPFPRKKPFMLLSFGLVTATWFAVFLLFCFIPFEQRGILLVLFLALYILFYLNLGAFSVVSSIIVGKVIRYNIRGRLLSVTGTLGGLGSLILTFAVVKPVLQKHFSSLLTPYTAFFLVSSLLFFGAWLCMLGLREPPLASGGKNGQGLLSFTRESFRIVRGDSNYLKYFWVSGMLMSGFGVIQFFTMYAKNRLGVSDAMLAYYLACQVGANSLGSLCFGPLADKYGNRLAIRAMSLLLALSPIAALIVGNAPGIGHRGWLFCLVFILLGACLPVFQILVNYLLEISPLEKHPNYLGVNSALGSVFSLVSILAGFLMDRFGYDVIFAAISVFLFSGFFVSLKLAEPRHALPTEIFKEELPAG